MLNAGKDGLTEDTRFNRPAKDGEEFTEEGVYKITVSNIYTDRSTEKTIYVGSDSVLQAYVTNQSYTVSEINELVESGATINVDGTIEMPSATTEISSENDSPQSEADQNVSETTASTSEGVKITNEQRLVMIGAGGVVIVVIVIVIVCKRKKR